MLERVFYRTVTHRRLMVSGGRGAWWVFWLTLRTEGKPPTEEDAKAATGWVIAFATAAASGGGPDELAGMFLDFIGQKVDAFEVGIDDGVELHVARMEAAWGA